MERHDGHLVIAVYFDGDQTLWDFQALMRRTLGATIDELRRLRPGIVGDLSLEAFVHDRENVVLAAHDPPRLEEVRRRAFVASLHRLDIDDDSLAEHLTDFYFQKRFASVEVYPDVGRTLATVAGRHRVGLLSNGNSYPDRVGLQRLFDATVFADEVGASKPDPRIFAAAEQALPADQFVIVGDSLHDDVAGGQAAGWTTVWLNRANLPDDPAIRPDHTLVTLHGLSRWLHTL